MGVTEIQGEIRKIQVKLSDLEMQLENMKPKAAEESQEKYKKINMVADNFLIKNQPLLSAEKDVREIYILSLGYLTIHGKSNIYDRLLFLMRISKGIDAYQDSEQLYQEIALFNKNDWDNSLSLLKNYRYSFIVDVLILEALGSKEEGKLTTVAEIAEIFGMSANDLQVCAMVAKAVVTDNLDILDQVPVQTENKWNSIFLHYIPEEWLAKRREKQGEKEGKKEELFLRVLGNRFYEANSKHIKNAQPVKKEEKLIWSETSEYRARKDGIVFFIKDGVDEYSTIHTYVVSYFDDYALFCKWYIDQKKEEA